MPRPLLVLLALLLVSCSGGQLLDSPRRDRPIQVDGKLADWEGRIERIEKAGLSVGSVHDDEVLHLVLVAANPELQRQMLGLGLTLWLDVDGGKDRAYGIRYPRVEEGRPGMRPDRDADLSAAAQRERMEERVALLDDEFLLVTDEDGGGRLMIAGGKHGFELAMGFDGPRLVYELGIPLAAPGDGSASRYALILDGNVIALGMEVEAPKEGSGKPSSLMGGPGGMGGGQGGGQGGGRRGGGASSSNLQPHHVTQHLDAWIRLQLK